MKFRSTTSWSGLFLIGLVAIGAALPGAALAARKSSSKPETRTEAKPAKKMAPVDINTASQSELEALPGIGAATAKKIIAGRPYSSVSDLSHAGVPANTISSLHGSLKASRVKAATASATPKRSSSSKSKSVAGSETGNGKNDGGHAGDGTAASNDAQAAPKKPGFLSKLGGAMKGSGSAAGGSATTANNNTSNATNSGASTASSATANSSSGSTMQQSPGGGNGMVWVNLDSKVYHKEGSRWYGKTKHGQYMTEQAAEQMGARASKSGGN